MRERRLVPITVRCDACGHTQPITLNLPAGIPIKAEPPPNLILLPSALKQGDIWGMSVYLFAQPSEHIVDPST